MDNNKKLIVLPLSAILLGFIGAATFNEYKLYPVSAFNCDHIGEIVHYEATPTTIEHWSCCECHRAFADEGLTICVSENTAFDRERMEVNGPYYNVSHFGAEYDWLWDDTTQVVYDEEYDLVTTKSFVNATTAYFQTISTTSSIVDGYYEIEVTNNTDKMIAASTTDRAWGKTHDFKYLNPGQSSLIRFSSETWYSGVSNGVPVYGFAVAISAVGGGNFTGSVNITDPMVCESYLEVSNLEAGNIMVTNDETYGRVFTFNTNSRTDANSEDPIYIYLRGLKDIDTTLYEAIEIYIYHTSGKNINFTATTEDWTGGRGYQILGELPSDAYNRILLNTEVWNGYNGNVPEGKSESNALGFYDTTGLDGEVRIAIKGFIEIPVPQYYVASYFNGSNWIYTDTNITTSRNKESGLNEHSYSIDGLEELFIEKIDTSSSIEEGEIYEVQVTNNTDSELDVVSINRDWTKSCDKKLLDPGESTLLKIDSNLWNSGIKQIDTNDDGVKDTTVPFYGYAVRFLKVGGGKFNGSVSVSEPVKYEEIVSNVEIYNLHEYHLHVTYSKEHGRVYTFDLDERSEYQETYIYFRDVIELDTSKYSGVQIDIKHESRDTVRFTCWSEDWNGHGPNEVYAGTRVWSTLFVTADTWNGDRKTKDIGFYDTTGLSGVVSIAIKELVRL